MIDKMNTQIPLREKAFIRAFRLGEAPHRYTSFSFVLFAFCFLNIFSLTSVCLMVVSIVAAVVNCKNDDWHRHLWPWLIVAGLSAATVGNALLFLVSK